MNFLILHGTLGSPHENWFPWLARELENLGHKTLRPQLPTPDGQTPTNWIKAIQESVKLLDGPSSDLIIVAHSRSPLAACQYLQTINTRINSCFFVAGFATRFPIIDPYPALNYPFDDLGADWDKVKNNCSKFVCFAGDDDPYVPITATKDFAQKLGTELIFIPAGKHLGSNLPQFPQLLNAIKTHLKPPTHFSPQIS